MDKRIEGIYNRIIEARDWTALAQFKNKYPDEFAGRLRKRVQEWRKNNPDKAREQNRRAAKNIRLRRAGLAPEGGFGPDTPEGQAFMAQVRAFNQSDPRGGA